VPAQVVPGPAAQSLAPFVEMPKHLSIVGCGGFGAAKAGVTAIVRAAAKALAIVAAVMLFGFMGLSLLKFEQSTH
jgi:dihydroorotate dehydrogenase